ncbi:MAG: GAF domain-containing protein [Deltaproteobacteria bacterium]|nr:GAF domain-containing protein [Deltaproteobacteria bacterium]
MKRQLINYETLLKVTRAISHSKDPEEVVLMAVEAIATSLGAKGCAIFLINRKTNELALAASFGLSRGYLDKGPISAMKSIAAKKEGISSILSVPLIARGNVIGALRIYTSEPWEFTLEDVNFVQAMAQITGMALEMARQYKGLKDSIEILKSLKARGQAKTR